MANFKSKTIVFVYKRNKIKEDEEFEAYTYDFIDIVQGAEEQGDADTLIFKDNNNDVYGFIDDPRHLESEFVYAFPTYLDELSKDDEKDCIKKVKSEKDIADYFTLFQVYSKGANNLITYSMDPNNPKNHIDIETTDHSGIDTMISCKSTVLSEVKEAIQKEKEEEKIVFPEVVVVYANEMFDDVSKTVICQDDQIKSISTSIAKNLRITDRRLKDNLLVCGPTGVGKSEIFSCISKYSNVPITMEDSTEYTAAGYKGNDVTNMLLHLYANSGYDLEKTQRGIIIIDEIDKKVSKNSDHEVYSKAVLDSLLKMAEGQVYRIETRNGIFEIDTSFITFAMLGAFSGIEQYNETRRTLGFISQEEKDEENSTHKTYTDQTLIKYGLMPEFLGRSKLVTMNSLGIEELKKIMSTSNKSQLVLYRNMLQSMGIDFKYDDATIEAIAKKAVELKVGARSIKKIVEDAFKIINYELFSRNNYKELIISADTIEDNNQFILR